MMARDWSQLPQELLELIAAKSDDIPDCVRFSAVCTSWRSAASNCNVNNLHNQFPWVLDQFDSDAGQFTFYDFSKRKLYRINLKEVQGYRIKAMGYGWLLMEGSSVFLLNPLTKAQILLPDFSTDQHNNFKIHSAYISSNPASGDCLIICMVRILNANGSYSHKLLLLKPGYNSWTPIDIDQPEVHVCKNFCHPCEFVYIKGSIHLTNCCGDTVVCNVGTPEKAKYAIPHLPISFGTFFKTPSDDLLSFGYAYYTRYRMGFHLLKANFHQSGLRWSHVKDIGDAVLLLSSKSCTCVRARDCPLLKRNHVYIVGIDHFRHWNMPKLFRGIMVYDIANEGLEIFERLENKSLSVEQLKDSFWFLPTLSRGI